MRLAVLLAASLACVGIGFAKSAALSAHVKDLETLQKIIQYLRGEIVTAASPLPDAFWETGRRMRDPYRDFLQDISEDMRRPDGKTLPAILEENTAVHLADTRLTKEEKEEPEPVERREEQRDMVSEIETEDTDCKEPAGKPDREGREVSIPMDELVEEGREETAGLTRQEYMNSLDIKGVSSYISYFLPEEILRCPALIEKWLKDCVNEEGQSV